jgi:hypothetical protein
MRTFKLINCWLQIIVIAVTLGLMIILPLDFFYAYFIVGGIQFLSMLIHEAIAIFTSSGTTRRRYHNIVYVVVLCMVAGIWLPPFWLIYIPLLFLPPFMAAYYSWLCYRETYVYIKRPLSILK